MGMKLKDVEKSSLDEIILSILKKRVAPITMEGIRNEIKKAINAKVSIDIVEKEIEYLRERGYDTREIILGEQTSYILNRFAEYPKNVYRTMGGVKTPFIGVPDWHIGSRHFSEQAMYAMRDYAKSEKVRDIMIPGDFLQGRGLFRTEAGELAEGMYSMSKQVTLAMKYLREFPNRCRFHLTWGGHEEKIKSTFEVGYDALADVARRCKNVTYYGVKAKLHLNKDLTFFMMHSSGGLPYAISYAAQRIDVGLREKANVELFGHRHRFLCYGEPPGRIIIEAGTLQRENPYLIFKGGAPEVGWVVVTDYTPESADVRFYRPRVY